MLGVLRALLRCDLHTLSYLFRFVFFWTFDINEIVQYVAFGFGFFHFACFEAHPCCTMLLVATVFLLFDNNPFMWIGHIFFKSIFQVMDILIFFHILTVMNTQDFM